MASMTDGYEALVLGNSKERKLCDKLYSEEHGPKRFLDLVRCFHHISCLDTPFSEHVGYVCTCPVFFKMAICKHAIALTVLTNKNFTLPPPLDEHPLEKHDNARAAARAFAVAQRKKEVESWKGILMASDDEGDALTPVSVETQKTTEVASKATEAASKTSKASTPGGRVKKVASPPPPSLSLNLTLLVSAGS